MSRVSKSVARTELVTFDELFAEHAITREEREKLVWHLAAFRARKTVEALLPETKPEFDPTDILRSAPEAP